MTTEQKTLAPDMQAKVRNEVQKLADSLRRAIPQPIKAKGLVVYPESYAAKRRAA